MEDHAKLANVAVHPDARGLGVGRLLMDTAAQEARRSGVPEIRLTTHAAIPENIALYRHLGYFETGQEGTRVFMARLI